jgi:predicted MFS family arabinose efflux permease
MTDPPSSAPASVRSATIWFMAASTGIIVANIYYIQPLLADIARTFGLTVTKVGFVAMLTQVGTALGMLLFVPLGDTRERRSLITVLLIAATVALVFTATARNAVWLAAASFAVGMMASTVHLFVPFAAHLAPPRERGRVVGSVFSGVLLGILLARTFSGIVGAHLGWRSVYGIAAVMMLCVAVLIQFLLPRSEPALELSYFSLLHSTIDLIRSHKELRESAFLGACLFCCFSAFWTTLIFLLETPPYHYGSQAAGLFGLVGAAGAAGAPLVGRLADKHGARFAVGLALLAVFVSYALPERLCSASSPASCCSTLAPRPPTSRIKRASTVWTLRPAAASTCSTWCVISREERSARCSEPVRGICTAGRASAPFASESCYSRC